MASGTIKAVASKADVNALNDQLAKWNFPNASTVLSSVDLNNIKTSGVYRLSGSITHSAYGNYGVLVVYASGADTVRQIQYTDNPNNEYTRTYYSNAWTDWKSAFDQYAAYDLGSGTLSTIQSAMLTYVNALEDNAVRNIMFTITETSGAVVAAGYRGTVRKIATNRLAVTAQAADSMTKDVEGLCYNGTWTWTSVNSDITPSSGTVTAGSNVTLSSLSCKKSANIVTINGAAVLTGSFAGKDALIMTLPTGFRPSSTTSIFVYTTYQGAAGMYQFLVQTDGKVVTFIGGNEVTNVAFFNVSFCI